MAGNRQAPPPTGGHTKRTCDERARSPRSATLEGASTVVPWTHVCALVRGKGASTTNGKASLQDTRTRGKDGCSSENPLKRRRKRGIGRNGPDPRDASSSFVPSTSKRGTVAKLRRRYNREISTPAVTASPPPPPQAQEPSPLAIVTTCPPCPTPDQTNPSSQRQRPRFRSSSGRTETGKGPPIATRRDPGWPGCPQTEILCRSRFP